MLHLGKCQVFYTNMKNVIYATVFVISCFLSITSYQILGQSTNAQNNFPRLSLDYTGLQSVTSL